MIKTTRVPATEDTLIYDGKNGESQIIMRDDGSGVKVEFHNKQDDPSYLAMCLAEELQNNIYFENDMRSFSERSGIERKKAREMEEWIEKVNERRELRARRAQGEDVVIKTRRMDPLDTFEPGALTIQRDQHLRQAEEFRVKALQASEKALHAKQKADDLSRRIRELNKASA